jgi:hypothetical protein
MELEEAEEELMTTMRAQELQRFFSTLLLAPAGVQATRMSRNGERQQQTVVLFFLKKEPVQEDRVDEQSQLNGSSRAKPSWSRARPGRN